MNLRHLFTEHPASVGETYFQHLGAATGFALRMLGGALACFLHALLPFAFQSTGSRCISDLHERMIEKRRRTPATTSSSAHARVSSAGAAR